MNIRNLSIGDWVKVDIYPTPRRVMRVNMEWSDDGGSVYLMGVARKFGISVIDPIPLTPEILEKNGFVKESEVGYEQFEWRENGSVAITLNRDSFSKSEAFVLATFKIGINGWLLKIEHVHQLQHAIRLAGLDKEIEV